MSNIPKAITGAIRTPYRITWLDDTDGTALDLTGATITGIANNLATGANISLPSTQFALVNTGSDGLIDWTLRLADLLIAGTYEVQLTATFGAGGNQLSLRAEWEIEAAVA